MDALSQIKPRSRVDTNIMCFIIVLIHAIVVYGDFVVAPWMIQEYNTSSFQLCLYNMYGLFLYVNVLGNMLQIALVNTTTSGNVLPITLKPGWQFCAVCEANSPPRSYHCQTCNRCILKRDHHCMFTGKCIGYFNHRYYLCLVMYAWLGAAFACTYSFGFVWTVLGGFSMYNLLSFCLPIPMFLFGLLEFYVAAVSFMTLIATLFWVILTVLLIWHSKNIFFNLTTHERRRNIYTYNLGWKENLRQIFGTRWHVCWIFPWIHSPMPGDGIEFPTSDTFESAKDL